jgi:uncharacterized protein YbjT (DUF2867 family)
VGVILVVGATGVLGSEICRRLRQSGAAVAGLVRVGSRGAAALEGVGVELRKGDLKDSGFLADACAGVEIVVSTATSTTSHRRGDRLETVDRDGQLSLVAAARAAGVRRMVYVSLSPRLRPTYLVRIKRQVEAAVRASGMEWVILQPSAFTEIWLSARLGWDFPGAKVRIVGKGDQKVSFISVGDVASFAVLAAVDSRTTNRDLILGGPEALSPLEIVELFQQIMGRAVRVRHFPLGMLRAMARLLRPISPIQSELMLLGEALAEDGDDVDMAAILREFPMQMTSLSDYLRRVARERGPNT